MKKISRQKFIKSSGMALIATVAAKDIFSKNNSSSFTVDENMMTRLVKGNDRFVKSYLNAKKGPQERQYYRNLSNPFAILVASYCNPKSFYYKSPSLLVYLEDIIQNLIKLQYPDGTLDAGGNRKSPPDTAFLLESLCPAATILKNNDTAELISLKNDLRTFLLKAGEGIRTGGIHTPNHRWAVSSALASLYSIFNDSKYLERIDEWLGEGIYIDEDGQYPERSRNYSIVVNNSLLNIGRILNRPELFNYVRKNLEATYYYMESDGELVCLDSRRQDQYKTISITSYYLLYRLMAIQENNDFFAAITRKIETFDDFGRIVLSKALPIFMENTTLNKELPKSGKLPDYYTKHFVNSNLTRIRRGDITTSIYAGNDKPLIIASGRSCIPTFFTFRKRFAVLEYARISTCFFNTGYIRCDNLIRNRNEYILTEKKDAYYYHPLPANKRNKNGDYELSESLDRRFWSKMDFTSRPFTKLTLDSSIKITEVNNTYKIDFNIQGVDNVEVTLELCFRNGGRLEGVINGYKENEYFLENGYARYIFGSDTIEVGPGICEHKNTDRLDGEVYSTHFGSVRGEGLHLFITGLVPFKHSVSIK